jgi:hypothetical protein
VEHLFTRHEGSPIRALALSAAAVGVLWLVTYDVAILQLGRYLVLWPPSVIAMLSRFAVLELKPRRAAAGK